MRLEIDQSTNLLVHLPEFRVVVCRSCKYALRPNSIERHLKDIHRLSRAQRKLHLAHISGFDLAGPDEINEAAKHVKTFPVPSLRVLNGLQCLSKGCSHLCATEKRMRSHWTREHGTVKHGLGVNWMTAKLQTFFSGNSLRYFTKPNLSSSPSLTPLTLEKSQAVSREVSLLHHYMTHTSLTLAYGVEEDARACDLAPAVQDASVFVWREAIPDLARDNQYLLHGIVSCAALHLAALQPDKEPEFEIIAAQYQDLAVAPFREAMQHLNSKNCNAVFAMMHIVAITKFAAESTDEDLYLVKLDDSKVLTDWLSLLRTGCEWVASVRDSVETGPLRAFLCEAVKPKTSKTGSNHAVTRWLITAIPPQNSQSAWTQRNADLYRQAANELGHAYDYADRLGNGFNTWDALRVWPMLISADFLALLHAAHPGALIVFAQYCHLLSRLDGKWYFQGKSQRLLAAVYKQLDIKWHGFAAQPGQSACVKYDEATKQTFRYQNGL